MFEAYVKEREGATLLKHEHGFGIYKPWNDEWAYLQDVYVQPTYRRTGVGAEIVAQAIELAVKSKKKALIANTDMRAAGVETSIKSALGVGFKVLKIEPDIIWYIMPLQGQEL